MWICNCLGITAREIRNIGVNIFLSFSFSNYKLIWKLICRGKDKNKLILAHVLTLSFCLHLVLLKYNWSSQDGGGLGWGDHFLSYKFIQRTIERWTNFTKQLLIASRGHQAPRKAIHCLQREVGQNIKDKKGEKRARDGDLSQEGSLNRGSFQSAGNPRTGGSGGSFQILEGNLIGRKN